MADQKYSLWEQALGLDKSEEDDQLDTSTTQAGALWEQELGIEPSFEESSPAAPTSPIDEVGKTPPLNPDSDTPHIDAFASMLGDKVEPVKEWWDNITAIGGESLEGAKTSMIITDMMLTGGKDEDVDTVANAILEDIKNGREKPDTLKELYAKIGEEGKKVDQAEGVFDTVVAFTDALAGSIYHAATNLEATSYAVTESSAYSLPAMGGGVLGSRMGPMGVAGGVGLGTFAVEAGAHAREMILEKAAEQGIPVSKLTTQDVKNILGGEEFYNYMVDQGTKAGLTVAAVEAVFGRFAGRFMASGKGNKFVNGVLDTTIEMTGEMTGEAAKSITTDKEFVASEVISEGVFGLGQSAGTALIGASARQTMDTGKRIFGKEDGDIRQQRLDDLGNEIQDDTQLPDNNEGLPIATDEQVDQLQQQGSLDLQDTTDDLQMDILPGENPNIAQDGTLNISVEELQAGDALDAQNNDTQPAITEPKDNLEQELVDDFETQDTRQGDLFADQEVLSDTEQTGQQTDTAQDTDTTSTVQEPVQETSEPSVTEETQAQTPEPVSEDTQSGTETKAAPETTDTADTVTEEVTDASEQTTPTETSDTPQQEGQTANEVEAAANEAATSPTNNLAEPTEAQKEAGNYKKGTVKYDGMDIAIETPAGVKRSKEWPALKDHYGYVRRTEGADGDQVDVFISRDGLESTDKVFVVDQVNADGTFDEHKVMLGFPDKKKAVAGYKRNYEKGWTVGPVTEMTTAEFKQWLKEGNNKQPVSDSLTGKPAKETKLKDIRITRTVTKADGTQAEMTGKADTIVRQYQKKSEAYQQLLRCVNG